jgi:ribonuclease inhibitor
MTTVTLDASHDTMDAIYTTLQRELDLSADFGRNLDALWDSLTMEVPVPVQIVWKDHAFARTRLGDDYDRLITTLRDVENEREDFLLTLA